MAYASTNSEWTSFYVDYKALKQILRQLSPTDVENQTEGNAQVRDARARSGLKGCTDHGSLRHVSPAALGPLPVVAVAADAEGEPLFHREVERAQQPSTQVRAALGKGVLPPHPRNTPDLP